MAAESRMMTVFQRSSLRYVYLSAISHFNIHKILHSWCLHGSQIGSLTSWEIPEG